MKDLEKILLEEERGEERESKERYEVPAWAFPRDISASSWWVRSRLSASESRSAMVEEERSMESMLKGLVEEGVDFDRGLGGFCGPNLYSECLVCEWD